MSSRADLPERERNARLRRVDWRFLLPSPCPARVLCHGTGDLMDAVASIASEMVVDASATDCDLAVAQNPDGRTLAELRAALSPGGACYTEWRPGIGGVAGVERALRAAGFEDVTCYRAWPAGAVSPMYWIPTESPGAAAYVRARARLRGGRVRRLLAAARQHADDLLHGRIGSPISAIARRPPLPSARHDPVAWLSDQWSSWGLGRLPQRVSTLLVTGGPRSVSKVVLLAFAEPGAVPVVAIKAPRVKEAVGGIRREGAALSSLAARYPGGVSGVPRMLDQRETDGVPLLSETALVGRPLEAVLTPDNLGSWSTKIADWLAALVGDQTARPPDHWCEAIVEPALSRFEALFGTVVDRGLLRECADIARGIGPFPSAPEQRDFGPWNVLVTTVGDIAVLDWESAEMDGLPVLDLLYYLAYASFSADGARDRGSRITSYRRSLDPTTSTGAIRRECLARYVQATGLESAPVAPLRALVWLIHAQSDARHAAADAGGTPSAEALSRSLFLALWKEEMRSIVGS